DLDVAALVSGLLLVAEVDRPPRSALTMSDLIGTFGDGGRDAAAAQPGPVLFRGVALVSDHPSRARSRPASGPGHANLAERLGQQTGVGDLPAGEHEPQRPSSAITCQMDLGRQPATRAADGMIGRLSAELLVVRFSPLCSGARSHHADARARSSSRSRRPSPAPRAGESATAPSRALGPRRPARPTGRSSYRSCSSCRTSPGSPARVSRSCTARRQLRRLCVDPPGACRWTSPPGTTGRSLPRSRQISLCVPQGQTRRRPTLRPLATRPNGSDCTDGTDGSDGLLGGLTGGLLDGGLTDGLLDGGLGGLIGGSDGTDGTDSTDGTDGSDGTDGADGSDGTDGTDGSDGSDDSDGSDGTNGSDGTDGTDGSDGLLGGLTGGLPAGRLTDGLLDGGLGGLI